MQLRIVSCNDDFATGASNVPTVAPDHDVLMVQEGKRTLLDPLLGDGWGVHQDTTSEATEGSALAWRRSKVEVTAKSLTFGVEGGDLLPRWIAWARAEVSGRRLWLASAHRPPLRDKHLWGPFDAHLAERVANALDADRLVIVGMDANQADPQGLAMQCGLKWVAPDRDSIDGFLVSRGLRVTDVKRLPKGSSDHNPVSAVVRIEAK